MRDAFLITLTLILFFVIIGYTYNLMSPYLVKLGVIEESEGQTLHSKPDGGVFKSVDFGRTWEQKNITVDKIGFFRSDIFEIEFSSDDPRKMYTAGSEGIFMSTDSGETWQNILTDTIRRKNEAIISFKVDPEMPQRMYLATLSSDGQSRILKTKGSDFYEVYSTPAGDNSVTGLWLNLRDTNILFAGTENGLLLVSNDFGESWRILKEFSAGINDLEIVPSKPRIMYLAVSGKIFKTDNQGAKWLDISSSLWTKLDDDFRVLDLEINSYNEGVVYAATSHGLFRTENGGASFTAIYLPTAQVAPFVQALHLPPQRENLLLIGVGSQIHRTNDAGLTWQIKQLDTTRKVNVIKVKPDDWKVVFAGVRSAEK